MGEAAKRFDMQIQYCMALPRHLMASLEVPVVSQVTFAKHLTFTYLNHYLFIIYVLYIYIYIYIYKISFHVLTIALNTGMT